MKLKKLFVLSLLGWLPFVAQANFADVPPTQENAQAIEYMNNEGIIEGYPDGTFRPSSKINRAEFTKIIISTKFSDSQINNCKFTQRLFKDVNEQAWFSPYVCLALQKNIIEGYEDNTFRPSDEIVFSEAAKIIVETYGLPTADMTPWYAPYAQVLSDRKAIPISIDSPSKLINRGEMAEMIWRLETDNRSQSGTRFTFTTRAKVLAEDNATQNSDSPQGTAGVLELVNKARLDRNLNVLTINPVLQLVAQDYAEQMEAEGFFSHIDPAGDGPSERVTAAGYTWRSVAENIAKGQTSAPQVFEVWKDSPGHWRNIISSAYTETGIGQVAISDNEFFRGYYWVQVFGTKLD